MRAANAGFTLAETMVAVAIMALIGTLSFGTFGHAVTGRERAREVADHYHQVRQAMLRMAREISTAFISEHRYCDERRTATVFHGRRAAGGMRLDFTSFSHFKIRADANESDQNELSYFLDDHPRRSGELALIRREQARIDDDPEDGGVEQVLATNVTNLEFEFYDAREDRWEDEWDTGDAELRTRLPRFVKIAMTVRNPDGKDETFVTKTGVFLTKTLLITGISARVCPT